MSTYPSSHKEWLGKLISFDTTSRNSNLELIRYIEAYLKSVGVESTLVYNPEKTKANLFATFPADNGATQGGIILSGHTDVVPVDGQKWDSDPFVMVEKDGKLFGRGACDMKSFIAVVMSLTPAFLQMKRAKPIHYAFSFDEEVGCIGARILTAYLKDKGFKADGCLIGEPTSMRVYTGNKGISRWYVSVRGKAIHSSMALMNTSCNAIEYAAQIITKIREIALEIKKNGVQDKTYQCPFACISTGVIKGGNAVNTVPAECEFVYSVRVTDGETANDIEQRVGQYIQRVILPSMKEEYPEASVEVTPGACYPAFNADEADPVVKQSRHLCKDHEVRKIGGGTEAGYFQNVLGVPTVIVGPGPFEMAHLPNEYVSIADMDQSTRFTMDLVKLYTDPAFVSKQ
ncbi:glutamamyl carboxypeptidase putativemetallo-peptidase Clan MH Family M18 [Leptomonas pyrrhocoris]|uniref:Glutamamyl carboxypeptidase putativemetallo-peptidase Clan MH Family M18 n=1 Tax=Leptomonas pyrrhocoris TaxID=157538 RepID=A0A0M9FP69_LEPPY|nr:glutamamyl carboxypeptidase putativemetallo-peptidase Clan MH Family M18 [Leptomonas pyrrhocoris]XP_015651527.1 glutamamyl carboxypeptidase putativemetallo-peptidase Clan MH Family M18 [Leptomonas pyrrhocoris]XP_015651528.1 glutamamyl carboxypeptidase putativemetallo-peptidase Clan MH Family M18 [Leptomonas pyrrhocoris]KPA73087.1 glutamamyl carboxypeptidase putativemetallo-peptidase Clan MH Family M18 [Leptomonas pyrrhocoris]KPA73088.1 glutamamyl carboxypeptidase putativemetallo-peptidase Cl|eukprot:XP_015651526.1 glutamamyl carboxypeptidase putativemetallo-peptidase Clan MH Family M18 [Leptomonas pyrrhocoris]